MSTISGFKTLVQNFPEVTEQVHFEHTSFQVNKKIFVTLDISRERICVKLSVTDQDVFTIFDPAAIYAVPNQWGKKGWTFVELRKTGDELLKDILTTAFITVAPKRLSKPYTDYYKTKE